MEIRVRVPVRHYAARVFSAKLITRLQLRCWHQERNYLGLCAREREKDTQSL